ncbi:MAG: DUF2304 domain-containing protein [Bacilli bacterium]
MNIELKITLLVVVLILIILVLNTLKNKNIMTKYALLWIISSFVMLIAVIFPNIFESISKILGFETTSNMIFLFGFFILLCISFSLTLIISKQKKEMVNLIQQVSILNYRFENEVKKR